MQKIDKKEMVNIILNVLVVLTAFYAVLMYFIGEPDILGSHDIECFKYFTTDSNIIAAVGSFLYLIFFFAKKKIPGWVVTFKFVGTVAASITLLTVCFFLAPIGAIRGNGFQTVILFFKGNVFFLHFLTPLLSIGSTLFLEKEEVSKRHVFMGVIPSTLYGFIYLIMVVFLKKWNDWYGFTFGGKYQFIPLVMIIMFSFAFGLSYFEYFIKRKMKYSK